MSVDWKATGPVGEGVLETRANAVFFTNVVHQQYLRPGPRTLALKDEYSGDVQRNITVVAARVHGTHD